MLKIKINQLNDKPYYDSHSQKKPSFGKKAISAGLMTAFLGIYSEANKLFGKTEDVKQVYPVVQTLPAPRSINIPDVKIESVDVPYPPKSFRYDLNKNKLIPVEEYEQKKVQENKSKDGEPEAKKEKKGSWFSRNWYWAVPAGIAAAAGIEYAVGDPLHIFKKKIIPPKPPEEKPDVTVVCYNLNGVREQGSRVILDGNYYDTSNGEVTVKDIAKGSHSFDYEDPDVYSQWLIVRNSLNGTNMQQKDVADTDSNMSITSDTTVYLLKIPKSWDMSKISNYLEDSLMNKGLYKFKNSTIPVVEKNLYNGDASETKRLIQSNVTQMNNAQKRGEFTAERQKFDLKDYDANNTVPDPKIDIEIKDIGPNDATHGELLSGNEITNTLIKLQGDVKYIDFDTVVHEMFQGITHTGSNDVIMKYLHDGETLNELAKEVVMVYVNSNPGTKFLTGSGSAQSLSAKKISKNKSGEYDTPSLDLNKDLGNDENINLRLSGRENDKRVGVGGRFNVGNGSATLNIGSDGVVARLYQKLLGNDINVSYVNGTTMFEGGANLSKRASVNVYIPDMKNPENAFLTGRYKGRDIDATLGIRPGSMTVRTQIDLDKIEGVLDFYKDKFGSRTLVGFGYKLGNMNLVAISSKFSDLTSYDICIIWKMLALTYGKDITGKDKISVCISN